MAEIPVNRERKKGNEAKKERSIHELPDTEIVNSGTIIDLPLV